MDRVAANGPKKGGERKGLSYTVAVCSRALILKHFGKLNGRGLRLRNQCWCKCW